MSEQNFDATRRRFFGQVAVAGVGVAAGLTLAQQSFAQGALPELGEAEPTAETPPAEAAMATATTTGAPGQPPRSPAVVTAAAASDPTIPTRSPADTRRVQAGVGTLVPGLLLFVPMAAVLAQRGQVERSLRGLQADTAGRALTDAELERAASLDRQFRGTTTAAALLGATGAALAVTGLVLLATRPRRSQVALAPWGGRGVGGLVLGGKF